MHLSRRTGFFNEATPIYIYESTVAILHSGGLLENGVHLLPKSCFSGSRAQRVENGCTGKEAGTLGIRLKSNICCSNFSFLATLSFTESAIDPFIQSKTAEEFD